MTSIESGPRVDLATIIGLGLLLMPLTTMWHEIGGHAAACAIQGGHVASIGAFYVNCDGLSRWPNTIVALAGAGMDTLLAGIAYGLWRRATGDMARLVLWLVWVGKGLVAAGYIGFSGLSGFGDLAPGFNGGGGLGPVPYPVPFRIAEVLVSVLIYVRLIRLAIATLATMVGAGPSARHAVRRIAHGYYVTVGAAAVIVGLFNPVGIVITALSAAASSFGGLAGFISIGYASADAGLGRDFTIARRPVLVGVGMIATLVFAAVFGPTRHF